MLYKIYIVSIWRFHELLFNYYMFLDGGIHGYILISLPITNCSQSWTKIYDHPPELLLSPSHHTLNISYRYLDNICSLWRWNLMWVPPHSWPYGGQHCPKIHSINGKIYSIEAALGFISISREMWWMELKLAQASRFRWRKRGQLRVFTRKIAISGEIAQLWKMCFFSEQSFLSGTEGSTRPFQKQS